MDDTGHNLVTGGSGFIGSHLVESLLEHAESVTVIDDLSTGRLSNLDRAFEFAGDRLRFVEGSLPQALLEIEGEHFDRIFHLAAAVGVKRVLDRPIESIESNIGPTAEVLRYASNLDPSPIVLIASSSEVYGKSEDLPFSEDADCVYGPTTAMRWSYAASKAIDEYLALAYHAQHGLRTVVARLFNTVGPRQIGHYGMVLPRFVAAAQQGKPLPVFGDGSQSRCFCDVRDVVPGMVALSETPSAWGEVFNLGSDSPISIQGLAKMVVEVLGSDSTIASVPYDQAYGPGFEDPPVRMPDLGKTRSTVSFEPRYELSQTILDIAEQLASTPACAPKD